MLDRAIATISIAFKEPSLQNRNLHFLKIIAKKIIGKQIFYGWETVASLCGIQAIGFRYGFILTLHRGSLCNCPLEFENCA